MTGSEDPYGVLGIARGATDEEVRGAYFARVREHPPERDPAGFKRIRAAYDSLRDPRARAREFLGRYEGIPLREAEWPGAEPVPVSREILLLSDPRCDVPRTDFSSDIEEGI